MTKEQIMFSFNNNEFSKYLENDRDGDVLKLFDSEGIEMLKKSNKKEDIIRYILTFSLYKNELLQNIDFLDVLLNSKIEDYYAVMSDLNDKTYDIILKRSMELNLREDKIVRLITFFDEEQQIKIIESKLLNKELIIKIFNKSCNYNIVQKIINTYSLDLSDDRVNVEKLFEKVKESTLKNNGIREDRNKNAITIPHYLINDKLSERLWKENNIYKMRRIINHAQYGTDITPLNEYVKKQEETTINTCDNETLLYPFDEIFKTYKIYKQQESFSKEDKLNFNIDLYYETRSDFIELCNKVEIRNLRHRIEEIYLKDGIEETYNFIKKLSNEKISNYIIDYHFEENYHNIMLDMNELLQFYYDGNLVIPKERLYLYEQIVNIDFLSNEEKKKLHEELKKYKMMELFYDDMRMARDIVAESIKEYSLSKESIKQYKDEELSNKYGVDVFNINGNPFFGIVKTGRGGPDLYPTGHSYSLVGDQGLAVFGNVNSSRTLLYDAGELNKEQIVHVFPYDSYTFFRPYQYRAEASMRVNTLMTPEKLTSYNASYNEILILEQGKESTDIDECIPQLKSIALYCIDNISQRDIEVAKSLGVGIILIDSSKYKENITNNHMRYGFNESKYNYFNGVYDKEEYEEKRR